MRKIFCAILLIVCVHLFIYQMNNYSPYAVCLKKAKIISPLERHEIILKNITKVNRKNCCQFTKRAGELKLTYNDYLESGVIWHVVSNKSNDIKYDDINLFFTSCGEVMKEKVFLEKKYD